MRKTPFNQPYVPSRYRSAYGLTPSMLSKIGSLAVLCGNIEYWLEAAIWGLKNENVKGKHPSTDNKPVTELINQLRKCASEQDTEYFSNFIKAWCAAAEPAFHCRNSIFHGVTLSFNGSPPSFIRNPRWSGEYRKRNPASFLADEHILGLIETVYDILLRGILIIHNISKDEMFIDQIPSDFPSNLREARSVATEISDLPAAMNHEKY